MKTIKPTPDETPIRIEKHKKIWGFNTGTKTLDRILDWFILLLHRPKLNENNLEGLKVNYEKSQS